VRKSSSVEQERRLLGGGVDIVVVLELCHKEKVVPVVLPFVHKEPDVRGLTLGLGLVT